MQYYVFTFRDVMLTQAETQGRYHTVRMDISVNISSLSMFYFQKLDPMRSRNDKNKYFLISNFYLFVIQNFKLTNFQIG